MRQMLHPWHPGVRSVWGGSEVTFPGQSQRQLRLESSFQIPWEVNCPLECEWPMALNHCWGFNCACKEGPSLLKKWPKWQGRIVCSQDWGTRSLKGQDLKQDLQRTCGPLSFPQCGCKGGCLCPILYHYHVPLPLVHTHTTCHRPPSLVLSENKGAGNQIPGLTLNQWLMGRVWEGVNTSTHLPCWEKCWVWALSSGDYHLCVLQSPGIWPDVYPSLLVQCLTSHLCFSWDFPNTSLFPKSSPKSLLLGSQSMTSVVVIYLNATSSKTIKVKETSGLILGGPQGKQSTWLSPVLVSRSRKSK